MNKKLARLVLATQRDFIASGLEYSYAIETVSMLIVEYWNYTPRADDMHDLVADWGIERDYNTAMALASWLLEQ